MTALERAFQLARSGKWRQSRKSSLLKHDGYDQRQIEGPVLKRQIKALIEKPRGRKPSIPRSPKGEKRPAALQNNARALNAATVNVQ